MARVDVIMPQMGESIAEGTVLRYLKRVGEPIKRDEDILEISTDKVDATVPSPASGLVPEGKTVEINTVLARIETEAGAAASAPQAGKAPAASEEAVPKIDMDSGPKADQRQKPAPAEPRRDAPTRAPERRESPSAGAG